MGYVDYGRVSLSDGPTSTITVPTPSKPREPVSFEIKFCRAMVFVVVMGIIAVTVVVVRKDKNTAFPVITTTTAAVGETTTPSAEVTTNTGVTTASVTTSTITSATTTMPEFAYCDADECAMDCSTPNCGTGCNGEGCADSCTGTGCGSMCTKQECAYECTNTDCGQFCNGFNCGEKCNGADCASNCIGYDCAALCTGDNCGTHCIGPRCARGCTGNDCGKGCAYPPKLDSTDLSDWSCALDTQNAGTSIEMGKNCTDIQNTTSAALDIFDPELCNYLNHPAVWPMLAWSAFTYPLPSTTEQCYKDSTNANVCTQTPHNKPVLMCTLPGKACNTPGLPLCSSTRVCGKCQGHCSNHNDCRGDLKCNTNHTGPGDIPGCSEHTPDMYYETGKGYCYDPPE